MPTHDLVVVANRLPVDRKTLPDGSTEWVPSPGGLVTAMETVMKDVDSGAWVGWPGTPDEDLPPFEADGMFLYPVQLSVEDVEKYYEGFSNGTLWPLYHDVIADPTFHRGWWDIYLAVNRRFARAAISIAAPGATIWVHDYQLQLVPEMIRASRPDVRIGFFNHIPFPPFELFAQLPKRNQVLRGLLGADLIGFQREHDTLNFLTCVRQLLGYQISDRNVRVPGIGSRPSREATAQAFPISIDAAAITAMSQEPDIKQRARELRQEMGNPRKIVLGVDRLDYTKGIRHRLKAYGELLADEAIDPHEVVMIQVATPSRERVEAYRQLRDEVELTVGRINGDYAPIGRPAISYQHRSFDRRDMTALYMAADVLLVTALRDGMNLVAKEYVAAREDLRGVLVLSQFAGAADELRAATLVNPHDIDELKTAILDALNTSDEEQERRMTSLRRQVIDHDVTYWAKSFLTQLEELDKPDHDPACPPVRLLAHDHPSSEDLSRATQAFITVPRLLIASDFDGVLAPLMNDRHAAKPLAGSMGSLRALSELPGVNVALVSGRSLADLEQLAQMPSSVTLIGSHGGEVGPLSPQMDADVLDMGSTIMTEERELLLRSITRTLQVIATHHPGAEVEVKPTSAVLHTRNCRGRGSANATEEALTYARSLPNAHVTPGKEVVEFAVVHTSKGMALESLRRACAADAVLYLGDDVTDEYAFGVLHAGDLGIKVGDGDTAASFRLPDPETVQEYLGQLLRMRRDVV
ncbi:bifunctional alpha,alpha-trehalose-phosphate synthase (UDP-forming)/trehalose-phosphatase [Devriesea agamarum]|uniref:bifunctional alpha,alpha-trehalose-phosphate synthase (UDP-forming)/trehalose-phosphatase n=1 Tax=Devriesea agamarum TaxID=472569 RepID=UPI00071DE544|nr:bifunctional alpha,alpha-trehalose-phosphate synthase (UDP-forming)/trehalose-phosphatase [Devriesea agamarum]